MKHTISIIGSGFSGLSAACFAAAAGNEVTVFEKNSVLGGRARFYSEAGFMFDMGPSWYWMPDVFENFFKQFGKKPSDYYNLIKLNPSFQLIFSDKDALVVPSELEDIFQLFERIEKGSASKLKKFLDESKIKYELAMSSLVFKPSLSWKEFINYDTLSGIAKSQIFKSLRNYVRSYFKDPRLVALMEFPVLFLGAMPDQIPALYSLMNYAAFGLGTWYPQGGMYKVVSGMQQLASSLGVSFITSTEVQGLEIYNEKIVGLCTTGGYYKTDGVVGAADYHHIESKLIPQEYRNYEEAYWDKKTFAPSCLIYYVGVNKKIKNLLHHNLFFDADFERHSKEIYKTPKWPDDPLFYVCCPSKTDATVAPNGMENLFVLVPVAAGLDDTEIAREKYFENLIRRMEKFVGEEILSSVIYKKSYSVSDFKADYNAFKGNAYGLANTLSQTAVLKPTIKNKKLSNLFYAGQLTVPGPGVPPALISGQIVASLLKKELTKISYEKII